MKTQHSFPVKPQITVKEGMVLFLARTTNLARLGMSAGEGSITVEEFVRRFCPRRVGDVVSMKRAGGRWLFNVGAPPNFRVNSIQLQRLNDLTEEERAKEDQPSNITFQRRDNPFLFVLGISQLET